jgi:signal transduction histidine kinase
MGLLATTAGILVWLGWRAQTGHFVPHPLESDPHLARNWFRMAIGIDVAAAALVSSVAYAVRQIEANYAEVSSALALLTGEQRRRADFEQNRQRVDRDWTRAACQLDALARNEDVAAGNIRAALGALTKAGAAGLGIERCGIWLFDEARHELRCQDLFTRSGDRETHDLRLCAAAAPAFFNAVEGERVIAAHRARVDLRTREMENDYLGPLNIGSLLAATIRVQGRVVGVVCGERVGSTMVWSEAQQSFAAALADVAARALSTAVRAKRVLAARTLTEELAEMLEVLKVRMAGIPTGLAAFETTEETYAMGTIDRILERVLRMSSQLRAPALDEAGLAAALRADLDLKAAASGVRFELDASKLIGPGSPEVDTACFWIIEELVSNIIARSDTELVQIRLERDQRRLRVTIEDDGWGAPTNPGVPIWARGPIVRVRERARAIGGSVNLTLCAGAGSLVEICLPDPPTATASSEQAEAAILTPPAVSVGFAARLSRSL